MPLLLIALASLGFGAFGGSLATTSVVTNPPMGNPPANGLNVTKIAGYAIAGGLVYYFGKKLIK